LFGFCTTRPYLSIYTYPTCIPRCAYPSATEPRRLAYPNSFTSCRNRRRTAVKASPAMYTSGAIARVRGGLVVSLSDRQTHLSATRRCCHPLSCSPPQLLEKVPVDTNQCRAFAMVWAGCVDRFASPGDCRTKMPSPGASSR
jgi:hypothetical protein